MAHRSHERRGSSLEIEIIVRQRTDGRPTGKTARMWVQETDCWYNPSARVALAKSIQQAAEQELDDFKAELGG